MTPTTWLRPGRALALLATLLTALWSAPPSQAADEAARLKAIVDATVRPLMARHHIPGMAVALSVHGQAQVFNYGVSSRQAGTPVTDKTIFELGSISKLFTATLAAQAQASGRLSLDDHPGQYLPRLRGRPIDQATLLQLGTYTAGGLPLQFPDEVADDAAAMDYFHAWQASAPPGTLRLYSNPSIGLLGLAAAAALQDGFAALVERQLFAKLGMQRSHLRVPAQAMADYAWGEHRGRPVRVAPGPLEEPAYGIKSTAADLLRFVQANLDPSGLQPPLRQAIEATQVGHFRVGGMVQGLGWQQLPYPLSLDQWLQGHSASVIFDANAVQPVARQAGRGDRGDHLFDKTGSTRGFGAYVLFVPARRIGLVMLANTNWPIAARVEAAHTLLQRLAPGGR